MDTLDMASVEKKLCTFYGTEVSEERQEAHAWLVNLQESSEAWNISVSLLEHSTLLTGQLFAVNCLYYKLTKNWPDTVPEETSSLQKFLWGHAFTAPHPILVKDRLCSCLAVFALQTLPDIWAEPISQIIQEGSKSADQLIVALQILAAMPYCFRRLSIPVERRSLVRGILARGAVDMQTFLSLVLTRCFAQDDARVSELAVNCLEQWLEFESDLADWEPIIVACLDPKVAIKDQLFGPMARLFQNITSNVVLSQFKRLSLHIFQFLAAVLVELLDQAQASEDLEVCATLAKMIGTAVENHAAFLLALQPHHPQLFETILIALLKMSLAPAQYPTDEQYSLLTVRAWTSLYEDLHACIHFFVVADGSNAEEGNRASPKDKIPYYKQLLAPYYGKLVQELLRFKLKLIPDMMTSWSTTDNENFVLYRLEFSDLLSVAHRVMLNDYFTCIDSYIFGPQSSSTNSETSWIDLEIGMYALEAISDNAPENDFLHRVFQILPNVSIPNEALANASLRVITKYVHVIVENNWISLVLPYVIKYLESPATVTQATLALKDLSEGKQPTFFNAAQDCLQSVGGSNFLLQKLYSCVDDGALIQADRFRALTCIGYIISFLSPPQIIEFLNQFVSPKINRLKAIADGVMTAYPSKERLLEELDFLAVLVGSIDPLGDNQATYDTVDPARKSSAESANDLHPIYLVMEQCLPIFRVLYQISGYNAEVAEKIGEIVRKSLVTLNQAGVKLVPAYSSLLALLFVGDGRSACPSCVLPVVKMFALTFASCPAARTDIVSVLDQISARALTVFSPGEADVCENYLQLIQQLAKKTPHLFSTQMLPVPDFVPIFQLCISGLQFVETAVLKQAALCLIEFLKYAESGFVSEFIAKNGASLALQTFSRLKLEPLVSSVEYLADVLFYMVKHFNRHLREWLAVLPDHHLVVAMMRENQNKRKFREFAKRLNIAFRKGQISL